MVLLLSTLGIFALLKAQTCIANPLPFGLEDLASSATGLSKVFQSGMGVSGESTKTLLNFVNGGALSTDDTNKTKVAVSAQQGTPNGPVPLVNDPLNVMKSIVPMSPTNANQGALAQTPQHVASAVANQTGVVPPSLSAPVIPKTIVSTMPIASVQPGSSVLPVSNPSVALPLNQTGAPATFNVSSSSDPLKAPALLASVPATPTGNATSPAGSIAAPALSAATSTATTAAAAAVPAVPNAAPVPAVPNAAAPQAGPNTAPAAPPASNVVVAPAPPAAVTAGTNAAPAGVSPAATAGAAPAPK